MADELEVPEEMQELMMDWRVAIECRDKAIASMFRAKRAIYYGKLAAKANDDFWEMARALYPETAEGKWAYRLNDKVLRRVNET